MQSYDLGHQLVGLYLDTVLEYIRCRLEVRWDEEVGAEEVRWGGEGGVGRKNRARYNNQLNLLLSI